MQLPFKILGVDYIELIVGNAKQAMFYYQSIFGLRPFAFRGLETNCRDKASYVLKQNNINFVLTSPLKLNSPLNLHIMQHGDGVIDVAFAVDSAEAAWDYAVENGAESALDPVALKDKFGIVKLAAIKTYGDTIHTFVDRQNYNGVFLPGYSEFESKIPTKEVGLYHVDHFVGNQPENQMNNIVEWYEKKLGFHRFWTVDDKDISTEFTSLRSIVVTDPSEVIKMPINRPAQGMKKSQIEEFVEFYSGPGIQHVALSTDNIIETVSRLVENGIEFLEVPQSYYDELPERVGEIDENIDELARLGILVDRDEFGYMLQIFTKPVQDRPTLFYEIIQRKGSDSFGKGNFKALFEAIEREQGRRGNL